MIGDSGDVETHSVVGLFPDCGAHGDAQDLVGGVSDVAMMLEQKTYPGDGDECIIPPALFDDCEACDETKTDSSEGDD